MLMTTTWRIWRKCKFYNYLHLQTRQLNLTTRHSAADTELFWLFLRINRCTVTENRPIWRASIRRDARIPQSVERKEGNELSRFHSQ